LTEDRFIKIGDLARDSQLSERSLRHYEALGILKPRRTEGGTRAYDANDVSLSRLIHKMRTAGLSLEEIAEIATERSGHQSGEMSAKAVRQHLAGLSEHLTALARLAIELDAEVTKVILAVDECLTCRNPPSAEGCPNCLMNELSAVSPLADLIWRD